MATEEYMTSQTYSATIGGAVYNVTTGLTGYVASPSGWYNVKDYGALGGGATDDTAEIQAAVDAAEAAGGGTVFFPSGTYLVSNIDMGAATYDNISLVGAGASSIIKQAAAANDDLFFIRYATNITFRDLKFDGNASNQATGANSFFGGNSSCLVLARDINSTGSSAGVQEGGIRFLNCVFYNWFWDAINVSSDAAGLVVDGCFFDGNGFTGGETYHFAINNQCKQFSIVNNQIRNIDGGGVYMEGDNTTLSEATYTSVDGFGSIANNTVENCLWGIRSQNLGVAHSIVGNQISDCQSGIALDASGLTQSGESDYQHQNIVANNAIRTITKSTLNGDGISILNHRNSVVSGNSIESAVTGIRITSSGMVAVSGNAIRKSGGIGVRISDSTNITICGNVIADGMQSASGTYETAGSEAGVTLFSSGSTSGVVINGNMIVDQQSSATQAYGILLYHSCTGVDISGNRFSGNVTANISDRLGTSGISLTTGTMLTAADGDATPTVNAARYLLIPANTGATAITQLDGGVPGQQVTLVATSGTNTSTITDGGNFLLSANWAPNVDDTIALFTVNGTTWREISRSAN